MPAEIHVGDRGTLYRARVYDDGVDFDPTLADVKQLIFRLPNGDVVVRDADVEPYGSPAERWYLTYQILPTEVFGSPTSPEEPFHITHGPLKIQAYLEWADGNRFHSDVRTVDEVNRELRIYENLGNRD